MHDGGDSSSKCASHCASKPDIESVYFGIRRTSKTQFKCKCFDGSDKSLVAGLSFHKWNDVRDMLDCAPIVEDYMKGLDAASALNKFLTNSTSELPNMSSMDEGEEVNICNPDRTVNIATLYLAHHLGLSVSGIIQDYAWDASLTHVFPNSTPMEVYIPESLEAFPNLEQAFWTIISHYTEKTEGGLRYGKDRNWCHYYGAAVNDHCLKTVQDVGCEDLDTYASKNNHCKLVYQNLVEVCHRVLSRDTALTEYKAQNHQKYWCLNQRYINKELSPYVVYRR